MIPHVLEMFEKEPAFAKHAWLICGKGPSFDSAKAIRFMQQNKTCFGTINQTPNQFIGMKADLAFYHDIEPMLDTEPNRAYAYCLPWWPHFRAKPDARTIEQWAAHTVNLRGPLLYSYDLGTAAGPIRYVQRKMIESHCFTYESVLQILGYAGVREIYTLGIDGGSARHPCFVGTHQEEKPASYDYQFEAEKRWKALFNLKIQRL